MTGDLAAPRDGDCSRPARGASCFEGKATEESVSGRREDEERQASHAGRLYWYLRRIGLGPG